MVTDLDFEEIDDLMGQMSDAQDLTEAIVADVAKITQKSPTKKASRKKSTPKSTSPKKDEVMTKPEPKNTVENVVVETNISNDDAKQKESTIKEDVGIKDPIPKDNDGTKVSVRVLTKYIEEPKTPVYKPNPKTGRFMDIVNPNNDMTIHAKKTPAPTIIPVATIVETSETIIEMVEDKDVVEDSSTNEDDRERIEKNGLNPDATIEQMMEIAEPSDNDDFLDEIMNNLGEDIEEDLSETNSDNNVADILSFPDRSDAFLSELDIEKRPIGGSAVANTVMPVEENKITADETFVDTDTNNENTISKKEQKKINKNLKKQAKYTNKKPQKKSKAGQALLYIALIILLVIFGSALGALAYFSGLF